MRLAVDEDDEGDFHVRIQRYADVACPT